MDASEKSLADFFLEFIYTVKSALLIDWTLYYDLNQTNYWLFKYNERIIKIFET